MAEEVPRNFYDFHISLDQRPVDALRVSPTNNNRAVTPIFIENDLYRFRFYFYKEVNSVLENCKYPSDSPIGVGGIKRRPIGSEMIFQSVAPFVEMEEGGVVWYEGNVNMTQENLRDELISVESIEAILQIQVSDVAGGGATERRTPISFIVSILKDAFNDTVPPPPPDEEIEFLSTLSIPYMFTDQQVEVDETNIEIEIPCTKVELKRSVIVDIDEGTGPYIADIFLSHTNARAGTTRSILLKFPASTDPEIKIRDEAIDGTVLYEMSGSGVAFAVNIEFVHDGTNWVYVTV